MSCVFISHSVIMNLKAEFSRPTSIVPDEITNPTINFFFSGNLGPYSFVYATQHFEL